MKVLVEVDLKWYTFSQNNSGGYFIEDENQGPVVCIQAPSAAEANAKSERMFDFVYCECCGERWDAVYEDEGNEEPTLYGVPVRGVGEGIKSYLFRKYAILHHFDGRVERVDFP